MKGSGKSVDGEGVVGIPLPHHTAFAFVEFKISNLVDTLGEFLKYYLSKI